MSVTSTRTLQIGFSGDVESQIIQSALENENSPGEIFPVTLVTGSHTVTVPAVSGITPKALTIIPPAGNTALITLKGVSGDTGIPLHSTDPTSIAIDETFASLVITVAADVVGLRLIWS